MQLSKFIKSILIILSLILFGELCFYAGMKAKTKPAKNQDHYPQMIVCR